MPNAVALAEDVEAVVKRLPDDVGWLCEAMLESEQGRRLLLLNPALAVATSLQAGSGENWRSRLEERLAMRPRDLAGRLGFGGSRRASRTLAKLEPESASKPMLRLLASLLANPREKWLFHLPALNATVLEILAVPKRRELVTFGFLVEVCEDMDEPTGDMVVVTIDEVRSQRLSLTPERALARIDSFQALMAEEDDLWDRQCRRQLFLPFPLRASPELPVPPELRGRLRFEPLRELQAIRAHGESQSNCLARGGEVEGDLILSLRFLYRVVARPPEVGEELEATLAVIPQDSGFRVDQLRLQGNQAPPAWLAEAVNFVLEQSPHAQADV